MTVNTKILLNGSEVIDFPDFKINKSIGESQIASNFNANLNNYGGYNSDKYHVGDNIQVYADLNMTPTTIIFNGIIEDIKYRGQGIKEQIELSGRDYSCRLQDRTVEPEVYTSLSPGSIVKDIISKYTNDITTNNVIESGSINRIVFNHIPVYDAIKQLADFQGNMFYVDENKDLHFEQKGGSATGYVFDNSNVLKGDFKEQRDTIFNQVWVYGDRYLDSFKEVFTAGSPINGSIFTLLYKPSNTQVTVSGALIQPGGVFGMSDTGSQVRYLVSYEDRQIIFTSGTNQGNNIPTSGNEVVVNYQRLLPVVKMGDDDSSQSQYGVRVKVIEDKNIKDPNTALLIMQTNLKDNANPTIEGNIQIDGVANILPGYTCLVNLPREGIDNQTFTIIEANYSLNKEDCLHDHPITIKLNKKLPDLTDTIKGILLDLKKLKGEDMANTDLITRYKTTTGSLGFNVKFTKNYLRNVSGITLIWNNQSYGTWNQKNWGSSMPNDRYLNFVAQQDNIYTENFNSNFFISSGGTNTAVLDIVNQQLIF